MTPEFVKEQNYEKQMQRQIGCMAGFLQIFDRHQVLIGKRLYSAKRLPPASSVDTTSESDKSAPASPVISGDYGKQVYSRPKLIPEAEKRSPVTTAGAEKPLPKSSLPFPIVELKEGNRSPWKFGKEAPRLSLDSRATTDAKGGLHPTAGGGQHHRSPSVIARLMGLEPLSDSPSSESDSKPELRRSASESRVTRDLIHCRFAADGSGFSSNSKQPIQSPSTNSNNVMRDKSPVGAHYADPMNQSLKKAEQIRGFNKGYTNPAPPWRAPPPQRKSFFDSGDIFPEPKQNVSIYGEIERRLRTGGINEQSKDLETLKQILEALQLKGLLHPKQPFQQNQVRHRNFVYDESPIVLLKSSGPTRRTGNDFPPLNGRNQIRGIRRNYSLAGETSPSVSPRRERIAPNPTRSSRSSSPTTRRNEGNSTTRRLNATGNQRKLNQSPEINRKSSPVHPPMLATSRQDLKGNNRSNKSTAGIHQKEKITTIVMEDESSSSSTSGSSSNDSTERSKADELMKEKESGSLLERCDKLLHSIAEMAGSEMQQPSPVSVLDPAMYKDEVLTPSPVTTKRSINFKDQSDEEIWSPVISPIRSKCIESSSDDLDFIYISDILRASHYLPDSSDVFLLLEKQQYLKGNDMSRASRLQRKLIFDTIDEILNRTKPLSPWKNDNVATTLPSLDKVWSEFQRIQEHEMKEDPFEIVNGVLKRDLSGDAIAGWGNQPVEMSEGVLDLERLIFKDLICEAIRDLAASRYSKGTLSSPHMMSRRKLVF